MDHTHQVAGTHHRRGATMSNTQTDPTTTGGDTDSADGYAHYANKTDITRAAIEGGLITALCGHRFSPVRDPQRFPVCPRCKELAGMLGIGGEQTG
jgi:Protein of unknown function (DUF3039)